MAGYNRKHTHTLTLSQRQRKNDIETRSNKQIDEKNCRLCSLLVHSSHLPSLSLSSFFSFKIFTLRWIFFFQNKFFCLILVAQISFAVVVTFFFLSIFCSSLSIWSAKPRWYLPLYPTIVVFYISSLCNVRNEQIRENQKWLEQK